MISLIGVDHRVQWKRIPDGIRSVYVPKSVQDRIDCYLTLVREKLYELNTTVFAEEYNQELHDKNKTLSTFLEVKGGVERDTGRNIHHLFIEPSCAEKKERGYKEPEELKSLLEARSGQRPAEDEVYAHYIAHQFPIREEYWVERLGEYLDSNVVLVCGETHLCTFPRLLESKGIRCDIIARGIGVRYTDKMDHGGISFAKANSMFDDRDCFCAR